MLWPCTTTDVVRLMRVRDHHVRYVLRDGLLAEEDRPEIVNGRARWWPRSVVALCQVMKKHRLGAFAGLDADVQAAIETAALRFSF